ncbi:hypothetical protein A2U01_0017697 [Trifolium medium]|uniref:Uncharacterized protein n=1 Tax=Trifolium medium TaxID=97028 RepID=A0A392NCC6_9FABA|nr:hypothetical protein [Trifolium medium]
MVTACDNNNYEAYNTYDDAVNAWEQFCRTSGWSMMDFQNGLLHPERIVNTDTKCKGSCSGVNKYAQGSTNASNANLDEEKFAWEKIQNNNNSKWIIQHNMQEELNYMCITMGIKSPVYKKEEVRVRKGIPYVRYKISLEGIYPGEEPFMCYGRFARQSDDAKEDAAVVAMRRLLDTTGHKIRDFNYYNVKILEQKIQVLEAEKISMTNVIRTLNEEIDIIIPESK